MVDRDPLQHHVRTAVDVEARHEIAAVVEREPGAGLGPELGRAEEAQDALSALSGDEVVLLLSSGPLAGLPDSLPGMFDRLFCA